MKLLRWTFALFALINGGLMAQQQVPHQWETIKDKSGVQADFPHTPLEMSFDIPFQNTPPKGTVQLYSVPTQSGLLVLSTFQSKEINSQWLTKEKLLGFFHQILVPHFFYNPRVFDENQHFEFNPETIRNFPGASFEITFTDHEVDRIIKGISFAKGHFLYICFYLSALNELNEGLLERFVNSVKIFENN